MMTYVYHMAAEIEADGVVTPLCNKHGAPVNLSHARWTLLPAYVTCRRCLRLLKSQSTVPHLDLGTAFERAIRDSAVAKYAYDLIVLRDDLTAIQQLQFIIICMADALDRTLELRLDDTTMRIARSRRQRPNTDSPE